ILTCIAVCMVVAAVPVMAFASEQTLEERVAAYCENLGDTDGNGKVNVTDARKALRIAVGLEIATAQEIKNADIDNDGGVTVNDARSILRYAVNLSGFDIPNSVVSKAEVLNLFVTAANKVKEENPGLDRKTTMVTPSIRVTFSDDDIGIKDMELYDTKAYIDEKIKEAEAVLNSPLALLIPPEKLEELRKAIKSWNDNKDNIDKMYEPQVETFHVKAGRSHYAAFTVRGKVWSSRAESEDVKSAVLSYQNGAYEIKITYDDSPTYGAYGEALPTDITKIPYGRMFDLESYTTYVKPGRSDFRFNSLKFKNGAVDCKINLSTLSLETATYSFTQIWDYTVIAKSENEEEKDSESRYVITAKNTAEYIIGQSTVQ
ncbi:MAG TPA: dockerin type I repeat-containing protein, partial [Oscillospiraceae bacterium]|nr:dockerin type I repeat-containing protein [Oscillospiraceae bacterium]